MEKRELTEKETGMLTLQYIGMTEDLKTYRKLFREKRYKTASQKDQDIARKQYEFYKKSLNPCLESIMTTPYLEKGVAWHAIFNRFVSCKTKWQIVKYLIKKRMP